MLSGPRKPGPVAVFISGGGSTLQALLEMHHQIDVALIVTNKKNALGAVKAKRFGKKVIYFNKEMGFDKLNEILKQNKINFIVLAGFMKIIPEFFLQHWINRIINIHPSMLPLYPGLNSAERSWEDNVNMGVSIHHVIPELDAGKILIQQESLQTPKDSTLKEAQMFLRRTEQFLLREIVFRCF
ncbi:phosphoribosylglycinamide formyltransferase [bacterium]|nr:phosphoribosylglycinamide formyltransferase [bacterium]